MTLLGQIMVMNNQTTLDDLNINIDGLQGGLDCNVDEVNIRLNTFVFRDAKLRCELRRQMKYRRIKVELELKAIPFHIVLREHMYLILSSIKPQFKCSALHP